MQILTKLYQHLQLKKFSKSNYNIKRHYFVRIFCNLYQGLKEYLSILCSCTVLLITFKKYLIACNKYEIMNKVQNVATYV